MRQNLCHKLTNESLFIGFAVLLLTAVATFAFNAVWPAIILLFTLRASYDLSKCSYTLVAKSRNYHRHNVVQALKA